MSKSEKRQQATKVPEDFERCHPNAAGIDIGAKEIWVSVQPSRAEQSVRSFATFTNGLEELATWLLACGVDTVAMESTGVYWVPLYEILVDRGIDPFLVNTREVKCVPGRKSDVLDCQWLRRLHTHGLLRKSFRPGPEIVEIREYLRVRDSHVHCAADCVRRMQKALSLMNLQLHHVVSDVTGKTGMAILRDIVAGERDPKTLATHRDYRCASPADKIEAALTGNYRAEHIFALRHSLTLYDRYQDLISECDHVALERIQSLPQRAQGTEQPPRTAPLRQRKRRNHEATVDYASAMLPALGIDLTAVPGFSDLSAAGFLSEVGTDMTRWPTAAHFCSWLRTCPRTDITGGKVKSRSPMPTSSRANALLRMAALNAGRTNTDVGAFYRSIARRKGNGQAVVATANKLARIIYTMLRYGVSYQTQGAERWEEQRRERAICQLRKQADQLGYCLVQAEEKTPDTASAAAAS